MWARFAPSHRLTAAELQEGAKSDLLVHGPAEDLDAAWSVDEVPEALARAVEVDEEDDRHEIVTERRGRTPFGAGRGCKCERQVTGSEILCKEASLDSRDRTPALDCIRG
jgi:hypothetical protein